MRPRRTLVTLGADTTEDHCGGCMFLVVYEREIEGRTRPIPRCVAFGGLSFDSGGPLRHSVCRLGEDRKAS